MKHVEHMSRIRNISKIMTTKDEVRKTSIEDAGVMLGDVNL